MTKPGRFRFSTYGNSGTGQNSISSISNFLNFFYVFWFPWCSTHEDLSIDVLITNVGLILTKLRRFQLFVKSKIRISNFFEKKIKFLGFHGVVLEDISIDVSITNVGLILTKLRGFLFSGCGQTDGRTDRVLESSHGIMSTHKKFQLKVQN